MRIECIQNSLNALHKDVHERVTKSRAKQIALHNKRTNIIVPNFTVGDFVLVRKAQDKGPNISFRWVGPKRISKVIGEMVYDVTGLKNQKTERVHAARLYRSDVDRKTVSDDLLKHLELSEAKYDIIDKLLDIGDAADGLHVQVQWEGLPDKVDWTWDSVVQLYEDIPEQLESFLRIIKKTQLAEKALELISSMTK